MNTRTQASILALLVLLAPGSAAAADDLRSLLSCQKAIARAGARFAYTVVTRTLKCTNAAVECQVHCENGVYGPVCGVNPPPCCDPDDPGSNPSFQQCMDESEELCDEENGKIELAELRKRAKIEGSCQTLSTEQLCGTATTPGLNFATLKAGCEDLIPGWTCSLTGIVDCVGGPMQQLLAEEIGSLLDPRSSEALPAAGVTGQFAGISRSVKLNGTLPAGRVDVWAINGVADTKIRVKVDTRADGGPGVTALAPTLTYLSTDGMTPVASTNVVDFACSTPNACGRPCATFKRRFPSNGTYYLVVGASTAAGCGGGSYKLVVTTDAGITPSLILDDVNP
jgi:hypothetical protein